ncbi:MAG: Spy/CpxP family protein refolding chaperone [Kiloniellaceae bacterium]
MRGRLPWILLAVSLAANVFFAAGVGYTVYTAGRAAESPDARIDLVAERLNLDDAQRKALRELRERADVRRQAMRDAISPMRNAILEQVARPTFDRDRVLEMLQEFGAERRLYFAEFAEDLHDYLVTLSPEQRRQFLAMARERGFLRQLFRRSDRAESGR